MPTEPSLKRLVVLAGDSKVVLNKKENRQHSERALQLVDRDGLVPINNLFLRSSDSRPFLKIGSKAIHLTRLWQHLPLFFLRADRQQKTRRQKGNGQRRHQLNSVRVVDTIQMRSSLNAIDANLGGIYQQRMLGKQFSFYTILLFTLA